MRVMIKAGERIWPLDGSPVEGLDEQSVYRICLEDERADAEANQYEARAGEVLLPLVRERIAGSRVILEWEWAPDFFAGEFTVEIHHQGRRLWPGEEQHGRVTVRTPAYKLTADDYQAMMADLCRWSTGWLSPAPGRRAGATTTQRTDSRIGALEYLIQYWPRIDRLVEAVLIRPRRVLEREPITIPLHTVRTFGAEEWAGTVASPDRWTEHEGPLPAGLARLRERAGGLLPGQVAQARVRSTLDVPENRLVAALLADVRQELAAVVTELGRYGYQDSPDRASLVGLRAGRARGMLRRVSGWLRSTWLAELEPASVGLAPSVAMLKHPVYGALWRHYLQWKRAVVLEDGAGRSLPLERTHQLYEFWCFLVLARELAVALGVDPERAVAPALGRAGEAVRLQLQRDVTFELPLPGVRLTYQRRFQYGSRGLRSVSHEMRPDITLEFLDSGEVVLFDPKYRVGHAGLVDGLGAMHRYRDAIVDASGNRVVRGAFLLCPGAPVAGADGRYLEAGFQERWGLGICVMRPGEAGLGGVLELYFTRGDKDEQGAQG
jgi:hypothetical protein